MKNVVLGLFILAGIVPLPLAASPGAPEWTYREIVTNPGTRSEGRVGYLHLGDEALQGYFDEIVIDDRRYVWHVRINLWDSGGYIPADGPIQPDPPENEPSVTPPMLDRGWYAASYGERRRGTPASWVWVRRDDLAGYIDPSRIGAIAGQLQIEPAELDGLHLEKMRPSDH